MSIKKRRRIRQKKQTFYTPYSKRVQCAISMLPQYWEKLEKLAEERNIPYPGMMVEYLLDDYPTEEEEFDNGQ